MALSQNLVEQFVKTMNNEPEKKQETTVNATYKNINGQDYVQIDGSDIWTPVDATVTAEDNDRVQVLIKNHTATITGNITSPSARTKDVKNLKEEVDEHGNTIKQLDNSITQQSNSIIQIENNIKQTNNTILQHENIINQQGNKIQQFDNVIIEQNDVIESMNNVIISHSNDIESINNTVRQQGNDINQQHNVINQHDNVINQHGNVINQYGTTLETFDSDIKILNSAFVIKDGVLTGLSEIIIDELETNTLNAKYANIDFTNINQAAVTKIFSESGIIKDLIVNNNNITGELVGVTIKGDLIEAGTLVADKLVVKGEDGLYYKLNLEGLGKEALEKLIDDEYNGDPTVFQDGLHGSTIIAQSITAEKVNVSDLVAFDATIGGFKITQNSIYSGVKESVENTIRGIYMDNNGQFAIGDSNSFIKYFLDPELRVYRLEISSDIIRLGGSEKNLDETIHDIETNIRSGARNLILKSRSQQEMIGIDRVNYNEDCEETRQEYLTCTVFRSENAGANIGLNLGYYIRKEELQPGDELTYSIYAMTNDEIDKNIVVNCGNEEDIYIDEKSAINKYENNILSIANGWTRFSYTFEVTEEMFNYATDVDTDQNKTGEIYINFSSLQASSEDCYVYWAAPKLEIGKEVTDWSEAPEDVSENIESKASKDELASTNEKLRDDMKNVNLLIDKLNGIISTLVVDEHGQSLMTQNGDGWSYSIETLQKALIENQQNIADEIAERTADVDRISNAVNNLEHKTAYINVGTTSTGEPSILLGESTSEFKVEITNTSINFKNGDLIPAYINNNIFYGENITVKNELRIGEKPGYIWRKRENGNLGLVYSAI